MHISIVLPVYNVAPFIHRCLKSVMEQTYDGNMECILIDDCGEDDSMAIARQLIAHYQGQIVFRFLSHDYNRGLSAARNTGIRAAQGEYLYFLDSDDWIDPQCIASLVALAERYSGVEMVQAGAVAHGGGAKPWLDMAKSSLPEYMQGIEAIKPMMLDRQQIPVTAWNRLISRDFLLCNGLFFEEGIIHEDELWTYQLSRHLSTLAILKQNVYHYEWHDTGLMAKASTQKSNSLSAIARQMIRDIDDCCQRQTVSYITEFVRLRSFDIPEESYRIAFLDCLLALYPYFSFCRRLTARLWLALAKLPIRKHYWLYTLLYHWKI